MMAATARPGTAADGVLGLVPRLVLSPGSVEEAAELLGGAAREKQRLVFVGGGTALGLGAAPSALDAVLRTERLDRIVEHAPSDQIVVAEAGLTLGRLQEALAKHGQRLALDPPQPERATLGGIVAANSFGPLRTRFGSVRDLIIGASFVRADGVRARAGGKVVKNVAGFDLPKLLCGSLGTLGLLTSVTFRLHPLPETKVSLLAANQTAAQVRALTAQLKQAQLEPAALVALGGEKGRYDLALRFEGFAAGVSSQRDKLRTWADFVLLDEGEAEQAWRRHDQLRCKGTLRARLSALPTQLELLDRDAVAPILALLRDGGAVLYPTLGLGFIAGTPAAEADVAAALAKARAALVATGGALVLHEASQGLRAKIDPWGPPPAALALMRSVKDRFDPERRLAPGRFVGGI